MTEPKHLKRREFLKRSAAAAAAGLAGPSLIAAGNPVGEAARKVGCPAAAHALLGAG
jgi:anaerobic selenocysteine-containing dehydrogenase